MSGPRRVRKIAGAPRAAPVQPRTAAATLRERVYAILRRVPKGRVVTYGQLALLAGHPRAARQVGWIAHAGAPGLPWQRVVNRFGGLASGYRAGRDGHRQDLERDGVRVRADLTVDLRRYQWWPDDRGRARPTTNDEVRAALPRRRGPHRTRPAPRLG